MVYETPTFAPLKEVSAGYSFRKSMRHPIGPGRAENNRGIDEASAVADRVSDQASGKDGNGTEFTDTRQRHDVVGGTTQRSLANRLSGIQVTNATFPKRQNKI
jgi:hypothetical protein